MNGAVIKWRVILEYKFSNLNSVPEEKLEVCAEEMELLEQKYINTDNQDYLMTIIPLCAYLYANNLKFEESLINTLEKYPEFLEQIIELSQKHSFKHGCLSIDEKMEIIKNELIDSI